MKSRIILVLLAVVLTSVLGFSFNSNPSADIATSTVKITAIANSKTVLVNVDNLKSETLEISLEDALGVVLFTETTNSVGTYKKRLSLVNLEAGSYTLIVKKNLVKTFQPFELTETSVNMLASNRKEKYLPNIVQKGNNLDINVLMNNVSNIDVRIYDVEGRLVFDESNKEVSELHKRFNLEKLTSGVYLVEVLADGESQNATIKL